jgi:hypothetical protein
MNSHKIGKRAPRSHRCINILPSNYLPHMLIQSVLYESIARWNFVSEDWPIYGRSYYCSDVSILVETSKELVMEVRVVRFYLMLQHRLASCKQLLLPARLIFNLKVNCGLKILGKFEVDDFILAFECCL